MKLKRLKLIQFGKFQKKILEFNDITIIVGPNASGKTTILDGVSFLSDVTEKKLDLYKRIETLEITSVSGDVVFNKEPVSFAIKAAISERGNGLSKVYFLNKIKTPKVQINPFPAAVKFNPEIVSLFHVDPSVRRQFVLGYLKTLDPDFVHEWSRYKAIVRNRNLLIKRLSEGLDVKTQIDFWSEKIVPAGITLIEKIGYWTSEIKNKLKESKISLELDLSICSIDEFKNHIENNFNMDKERGYTLVSPHTFDFDIKFNGLSVQEYGSRGQTKLAIVHVIKALCELYHEIFDDYPILLLDDIESELDDKSLAIINELLSEKEQQKIITMLAGRSSQLFADKDILKININE
ncbi:AAA family ATPase [Candidatus Dojkabacteria bacterium]|nr:AAA family ATPase [Candidatus Dojkabacteria bacterium]